MAVITGTNLDDTLLGTTGNDIIQGLNGNDQLNGGSGNDHLVGFKFYSDKGAKKFIEILAQKKGLNSPED